MRVAMSFHVTTLRVIVGYYGHIDRNAIIHPQSTSRNHSSCRRPKLWMDALGKVNRLKSRLVTDPQLPRFYPRFHDTYMLQ